VPREVDRLGLTVLAGLWLDGASVPGVISKLPHELPALLFHDPELGEQMMTAGGDLDRPQFRGLRRDTCQLAMPGKLLFPTTERGHNERLYHTCANAFIGWGENDRMIPLARGHCPSPRHWGRRTDQRFGG